MVEADLAAAPNGRDSPVPRQDAAPPGGMNG